MRNPWTCLVAKWVTSPIRHAATISFVFFRSSLIRSHALRRSFICAVFLYVRASTGEVCPLFAPQHPEMEICHVESSTRSGPFSGTAVRRFGSAAGDIALRCSACHRRRPDRQRPLDSGQGFDLPDIGHRAGCVRSAVLRQGHRRDRHRGNLESEWREGWQRLGGYHHP